MEGDEKNGRTDSSIPRNSGGPGLGRLKDFPKGFSRSARFSENPSGGQSGSIAELQRTGELSASGANGIASVHRTSDGNGRRDNGNYQRIAQSTQQFDSGIRNSTGNYSNLATRPQTSRTTGTTTRTVASSIPGELFQEQLEEESSFLGIETKGTLNIPEEGIVVPTRMMQRELDAAERKLEDSPVSPLPLKKKGRPASKKGKTEIIKPNVPYKFDTVTHDHLIEWFVWTSKGLDLGIDYGLGVDTSVLPIWEFSPDDAEVFVRILERRAAASEYVRDTVVPKLLASRDYIEAGILVAPRFIATVQGVVEIGGPKPHFKKREG